MKFDNRLLYYFSNFNKPKVKKNFILHIHKVSGTSIF